MSGRSDRMPFSPLTVNTLNPQGRRFWAWAEPDNAYNVDQLVNNNAVAAGRPADLPVDAAELRPERGDLQLPPRRRQRLDGRRQRALPPGDDRRGGLSALLSIDGGEP